MDNLEEASESLQLYLEQAIADGDVAAVRKLVTRSSHDLNSGDGRVNATALFLLSVQYGNNDIIESVLQLRPPPNVHFIDDKDRLLLHFAAETGSLSLVKTLLSLDDSVVNVHVNMCDVDGRTPIMIAASKGYADIVEFFIQKGGRLNEARLVATDDSILHLAAQEGHLDVVEVLTKHGADVNCRTPSHYMESGREGGMTVLHSAVLGGNTEVVKLLCANGADQSIMDGRGRCPFHLATYTGHIDMVQTFLDIGADVDMRAEHGRTALTLAISEADSGVDIVQMLIKHGADVDVESVVKSTPLMEACSWGSPSVVEHLIAHGADVNKVDEDGQTALHCAQICDEDWQIVEELSLQLIAAGAKINVQDVRGRTPLMEACSAGRLSVVEHLIAHGADVNKVDKIGHTALYRAQMCHEDWQIVEELSLQLIAAGAKINVQDVRGRTPLMEACSAGRPSVVEHLIAHGADVNKVDKIGHTALYRAQMCHEDWQIVVGVAEELSLQLIAAGAKINVQDVSGRTPLDFLSYKCCLSEQEAVNVIKILVRIGAELKPAASQISSDKFATTALLALVLDGFYESARFLVLAGWDVRKEKWLNISQENWLDVWQDQWQDEWMYSKKQDWLNGPRESLEYNDFMTWLRLQTTEPKSLTWLCRDSIRRTLIQVSDGKEILSKVAQLPVPPRVTSFLNLDDI